MTGSKDRQQAIAVTHSRRGTEAAVARGIERCTEDLALRGTLRHGRASRGALLITTLWIAMIALILGTSYLLLFLQDSRFARKQADDIEAFYLARSGLESCKACGIPAADEQGERRVYVSARDRNLYCVVEEDEAGQRMLFTGTVTDGGGRVTSKRTLAAPKHEMNRWYEVPAP